MVEEKLPLCKCGCGELVAKKGNRFIHGHNRCKTSWNPISEPLLCECGCGELAKSGNRFIDGHQNRGENNPMWKPTTAPERKLCGCGCGELANPGRDYINGHFNRSGDYHERQIPKPCKCGCGKVASPGSDYLLGHNAKIDHPRGMLGKTSSRKIDKILIICKNCGSDIFVLPSNDRVFCDRKCKSEWMSKQKGEGTANWQGGITSDLYCEKFTKKLRQQIRDQYANCDFFSGLSYYICNVTKNGKIRKLCIHHVDSNKNQGCDDVKWKLVPLSGSNHNRVHTNRSFWERLICYALEYDKTYYGDL